MESVSSFFSKFSLSWEAVAILSVIIVGVLLIRVLPKAISTGIPPILPADLKKRLDQDADDTVLIDVSTAKEFAHAHIPGAINIPVNEIAKHFGKIPDEHFVEMTETPIVLTCASGVRAIMVARGLKKAGFLKIIVLAGGNQKWAKAGLPLARETKAEEPAPKPSSDEDQPSEMS